MITIVIEYLGDNCPVQGWGMSNECPFYFRSRGEYWTMDIGRPGQSIDEVIDDAPWQYRERYSDDEFAAGWISETEAYGFIMVAARKFCNV